MSKPAIIETLLRRRDKYWNVRDVHIRYGSTSMSAVYDAFASVYTELLEQRELVTRLNERVIEMERERK
jgi:hypothetical protein